MTFVCPINYPGYGMSASEIFQTTKIMRKIVFPNASKTASKQCPSRVQAVSKPVHTPQFSVQAGKRPFSKPYKSQHDLVQAFRPTGLFIILKESWTIFPCPSYGFRTLAPSSRILAAGAHCSRMQTEEKTRPSLYQRGASASSVWEFEQTCALHYSTLAL